MRLSQVMIAVLLLAGWAAGQQSVPRAVQQQLEPGQPLQQQAGADASASKSPQSPFRAQAPAVPMPVASSALKPPAVARAQKPWAVQRAKRAAVPAVKNEAVPNQPGNRELKGRRDPFVSIIQTAEVGATHCSTGKQCLIVDEVVLRGVVKSQGGMLAVVENTQKKTYFLRDGDPVFNGQVVRITDDAIVFRERVLDHRGQELSREVVKRINGSGPAA